MLGCEGSAELNLLVKITVRGWSRLMASC